jgi:hypothetical protein
MFQFQYRGGNFYSYDLKAARDHVLWYNQMIDLLAAKSGRGARDQLRGHGDRSGCGTADGSRTLWFARAQWSGAACR